ncbi:MAG: GNAT family N-acetyltransferase [Rhizomicrobium sp.]
MTAHHDAVRQSEEHLMNAWPSLRTLVSDGWVLREARGYTKRANSACALAARGAFRPACEATERFYASFGHPTIFRLTPLAGAEPDSILADRGYAFVDETMVMTTALSCAAQTYPSVTISAQCTPAWEAGYANAHHLDAEQRYAHRAILDRIAPLATAYATVHDGEHAIAFGLGVVERGRLGLFDIVTVPEARRRGAARKLVGGLMGWGARHHAHTAWLSVIADNHKALPLYAQLGFRELYRYHYRVGPRASRVHGR